MRWPGNNYLRSGLVALMVPVMVTPDTLAQTQREATPTDLNRALNSFRGTGYQPLELGESVMAWCQRQGSALCDPNALLEMCRAQGLDCYQTYEFSTADKEDFLPDTGLAGGSEFSNRMEFETDSTLRTLECDSACLFKREQQQKAEALEARNREEEQFQEELDTNCAQLNQYRLNVLNPALRKTQQTYSTWLERRDDLRALRRELVEDSDSFWLSVEGGMVTQGLLAVQYVSDLILAGGAEMSGPVGSAIADAQGFVVCGIKGGSIGSCAASHVFWKGWDDAVGKLRRRVSSDLNPAIAAVNALAKIGVRTADYAQESIDMDKQAGAARKTFEAAIRSTEFDLSQIERKIMRADRVLDFLNEVEDAYQRSCSGTIVPGPLG